MISQVEYQRRREEIVSQIRNHTNQINAITSSVNSCSGEIAYLESEVSNLARQLVCASEHLHKVEGDIEKHQSTLQVVKQRSAAFNDALQVRKKRVSHVAQNAQTVTFARVYQSNIPAMPRHSK